MSGERVHACLSHLCCPANSRPMHRPVSTPNTVPAQGQQQLQHAAAAGPVHPHPRLPAPSGAAVWRAAPGLPPVVHLQGRPAAKPRSASGGSSRGGAAAAGATVQQRSASSRGGGAAAAAPTEQQLSRGSSRGPAERQRRRRPAALRPAAAAAAVFQGPPA